MATRGFDNAQVAHGLALSLPFDEGVGLLAHDRAKPHHLLTQHDLGGGSFTWTNLGSGLPYLQFAAVGGGATDGVYLDCPWSDTVDLNFTTGDFSVGGWINWDSTGGWSEVVIGRYGVDIDGWELYMDISGHLPVGNTLSQRHHHASLTPNVNSDCFSTGWTPGTWHFFGVSRVGGDLYPVHYRNGEPLVMSYETSGMLDPDTAKRDLVVGCRYTKDANWYRNGMKGLRVWPGRALSEADWKYIFVTESHWFR